MITKIPVKILPIEEDGFHLQLKVYINNRVANVLIDTGASKTVFDKNRITSFVKDTEFQSNERLSTGLGTNTMASQTTELKKLKIGEIIIENYKTVLLDLGHVNHSYQLLGLKQIDGVIGSDLLKKFKAVIDYDKAFLKLSFPKKR